MGPVANLRIVSLTPPLETLEIPLRMRMQAKVNAATPSQRKKPPAFDRIMNPNLKAEINHEKMGILLEHHHGFVVFVWRAADARASEWIVRLKKTLLRSDLSLIAGYPLCGRRRWSKRVE